MIRRKILAVLLSMLVLISSMPFSVFSVQIDTDQTVTGRETLELEVKPSASVNAIKSKVYDERGVPAKSDSDFYGKVDIGDYDTEKGRVYVDGNSSVQWYNEGETVTVTADPFSGFVAVSWTVMMYDDWSGDYTVPVQNISHIDPNTIEFTMPDSNVMVYPTFSEWNQLIVFVQDMIGGTVVPHRYAFMDGSEIYLTIQPDNGYTYKPNTLRVVEVEENTFIEQEVLTGTFRVEEVTENLVYKVLIGSKSIFVYAEFEAAPEMPKYSVTVDSETENGSISSDYEQAEAGWKITLTASPDTDHGYVTKSVTVTDSENIAYPVTDKGNNIYEFTMPAKNVFVTAQFEIPSYSITSSVTGAELGCKLDIDTEAQVGDVVDISVSLAPETTLESLVVTGNTTGNPIAYHNTYTSPEGISFHYQFDMPNEPVTVTAVFSATKYELNVNNAVEGTVTFSKNNGEIIQSAMCGELVTVTYVYENKEGTYEDNVDGLTYSFTMGENTATRPLDNFTFENGVYTGTFEMPSAAVEIGAKYSSIYNVSFDGDKLAAQNGTASATLNGYSHTGTFSAYPEEQVTLYAESFLSDMVRATWHVTYIDGSGVTQTVAVNSRDNCYGEFIMPEASVTVWAELEPLGVPFVKRTWDSDSGSVKEQTLYCANYTNLSSVTDNRLAGTSEWYVLDRNLTFSERITVSGTIYLILKDGLTLTCEKGICVPDGAKLYIIGQSGDSGNLIATGDSYQAGIGSNDYDDETVKGAGTIIIYGGTITAQGGSDGAGIGGGNEAHGGIIIICGGTVNATGGTDAAGIGTGDEYEGSNPTRITIYGGTVTATGGNYGAGIGGGDDVDGGIVHIYGGTVTATGDEDAAGIGGGEDGNGGNVIVYGGTVTAQGGIGGAGIGGGEDGNGGTLTVYGGYIHAIGGEKGFSNLGGAGIGGGCSGDGGTVTVHGGEIFAEAHSSTAAAGIGGGGYMEPYHRIGDGGTLIMYGGKVTANGGSFNEEGGAGVGGGEYGEGGVVIVRGGELIAKGGAGSAGIGGGYHGKGATVTIEDGKVTATGGDGGAGIGGGSTNPGGAVTISGGEVTAEGGYEGAGIGGGLLGSGKRFNMTGGTVTAKGGELAAGIGGGNQADMDEDVTISGGTLYAYGTVEGEGIGGGGWYGTSDGKVIISGTAVVYAQGGRLSTNHCISSRDTISVYPNAMIYAGDSIETATLLPYSSRGTFGKCLAAIIRPCDHTSVTYTSTESGHTAHCTYCNTVLPVEEHSFDSQNHCTVCGYQGQLCSVSIVAGDGTGSLDPETVVPGAEYLLPECTFTAPGNMIFIAWSVQIGENDPVSKNPGEFITLTDDTVITAVWAYPSEPMFKSQNLILSGKIGLSFNILLPEIEGVDYSTSYMTFTIKHGTVTEQVNFNEAKPKNSEDEKGFVAYVNSIQMAEVITAIFHYTQNGEEKTIQKKYSINDYFEAFDSAVENGVITDESMINLVHALCDYGHYVQPFLAEARNWTLGTDYNTLETYYTESYDIAAIHSEVREKALDTVNNTSGDIIAVTNSLTLDSDTVINVYFKPSESYNGKFMASVDGGTATEYRTGTDGRYCVRISGIAAHELSKNHTITVTTADGHTAIVTVSALSYVNSSLNYYTGTSETDINAQNAAAAIYAYSKAADAYKAAHSNN